jgi:hypothetical protein
MIDKTDLLAALDIAAAHLLEKAGVGDKLADGEKAPEAALADQVKAFNAVVDWAKTRRELAPPEKKESPFDGIRRNFNSAPVKRRRTSVKDQEEAEPAVGRAEPSSGAAPQGGLFDFDS